MFQLPAILIFSTMRYFFLLTYWALPIFVFGQTIANTNTIPTNKPAFSLLELAKRSRADGTSEILLPRVGFTPIGAVPIAIKQGCA